MRSSIFIVMALLVCSCRYTGEHINYNVEDPVSDNLEKLFKSEQLLDSLIYFIDTTDDFPNDSGKVFYTVDIALHKQDTLISLWSYDSVMKDRFLFFDSRFILELAKNHSLILEYDWGKLYESIVESPYYYIKYGAIDITDKQVIALTLRSNIDVTDIVSFDSLDVMKFDQYLKFQKPRTDRDPDVKIYRYHKNKELELIYRRHNNGFGEVLI